MGKTLGSLAAVAAALLGALALPAAPAVADTPVCSAKKCAFVSPNRTVCTIAADAAGCGWTDGDKLYAVKLFPNGGLDPCLHLVDIPGRTCDSYPAGGLPLLGYGQPAVLGPYTCLVDAQSVTCTVMPSGRGFTMNSAGIVPAAVAPAPPPPPEAPAPPPPEAPAPPPPAPEVAAVAPEPEAPVEQPLIPPPPEDMPPPLLPGPEL